MRLKIYRHELSVALTKASLFGCYKTHLDSNWYQKKKKNKKQRRTYKCNYWFNLVIIREKKNNLHRYHSQYKLHSHSPMKLWSLLNYIN